MTNNKSMLWVIEKRIIGHYCLLILSFIIVVSYCGSHSFDPLWTMLNLFNSIPVVGIWRARALQSTRSLIEEIIKQITERYEPYAP